MKFISVSEKFFDLCGDDLELLHKGSKRPHLLVLSLKYKGRRQNFAIPFRSNIPPSSPKNEYFPLPPRKTTKPKHRHGIHYVKMFPIEKKFQEKFLVFPDSPYALYQGVIINNKKQIISECQEYLTRYENGQKSKYAVDIDKILEKIK